MKKFLLLLTAITTISMADVRTFRNSEMEASVDIKESVAEIKINGGLSKKLEKKGLSGEIYGNDTYEIILKSNILVLEEGRKVSILYEDLNKISNVNTNKYSAIFGDDKNRLEIKIIEDEAEIVLNGKKLDKFYRHKSASGELFTNGINDFHIKGDMAIYSEEGKDTFLNLKKLEEKIESNLHVLESTYKNGKSVLKVSIKNDIATVIVNDKKYGEFKRTVSASGEIYTNNKTELMLKGDKAYFQGTEYKRISFVEKSSVVKSSNLKTNKK